MADHRAADDEHRDGQRNRGLVVRPGHHGGHVVDLPEVERSPHEALVATRLVGICGTDHEILAGAYGTAPPGRDRLVLGHESIGTVVEVPDDPEGALAPGALVVPIVRRPDPVPCESCAAGEWDLCRNGRYTEHGIQAVDGFARRRFAEAPDRLVPVPDALGDLGVLVEPTSIVAKAWEQVDHIAERAAWRPRTALVTGAGPVGLLAALLGRLRGLEVVVLDRVTSGPKPGLVEALGATYTTDGIADLRPSPDVVVECTGVGSLVVDAVEHVSPDGIVCLAGLSSRAQRVELDTSEVNRLLVLGNAVVFGTVNANTRHYRAAVDALARADRSWLASLITRRVPLDRFADALEVEDDDVKVVLDLTSEAASNP